MKCPACLLGKELKDVCEILFLTSLADGNELNLCSRSVALLGVVKNGEFYESFANVYVEAQDELLLLMNIN